MPEIGISLGKSFISLEISSSLRRKREIQRIV